jgi:cell volume regulation protein A
LEAAHGLILLGGVLGLLSVFAGLLSLRIGAPLLLVFLALGMLAGDDGLGGIAFSDFPAAYLIGSVAMAVILFQGGLATSRRMLRLALWPALALATVGVGATAVVVAGVVVLLSPFDWTAALLVGAVVAPTDAAAVASLLGRARLAVPERVIAVLEVESGLNDPMSVFLTVLLTTALRAPGGVGVNHAALLFADEMGGGALFGIAGGVATLIVLRRLPVEAALAPILALAAALTLFGGAQFVGASGFLAVYLMGIIVGGRPSRSRESLERFFSALGWLAQIVLFLMLGLLVTPHELLPFVRPALGITAMLIVLARPAAAAICLLPFGYTPRETAFAAWVGLRGGVPIFLTIIPVLDGLPRGQELFSTTFVTVIASLLVQGWTIAPAARLLGFGAARA